MLREGKKINYFYLFINFFQSTTGSYSCACSPGYTGPTCAVDIDECASSPCAANSTVECQDAVNSFTCVCMAGYTGADCSETVDHCELFGCFNGGTCTPLVNDFSCKCPENFNGTRCENQITFCTPNPCLFGGTCVDQVRQMFSYNKDTTVSKIANIFLCF